MCCKLPTRWMPNYLLIRVSIQHHAMGAESVRFFSGDKTLRKRYSDAHDARAATVKEICQHPALSLQVLSTADTDWDLLSWV
jgi:hypothetical protein